MMLTICGSEGTGKTQISHAINQLFKNLNQPVVHTREPGGTPIAEEIRSTLKDFVTDETFHPMTELLMFYAARNQSFQNVIIPALAQEKHVITDRSYYCSLAYQVYGSGVISEDTFWTIHNQVMKNTPEYDLIIHLYTNTAAEGIERARGRGQLDRIEQNTLEYFERVSDGYKKAFEGKSNVLSINTSIHNEGQAKAIVQSKIMAMLNATK